MEEKRMIEMNMFYGIQSGTDISHADISTQVNGQMKCMGKEQMRKSFEQFGLLPVKTYLDRQTDNKEGFIRYMDAYLVEQSGGKRKDLLEIGEQLTGQVIHIFSMRLIRLSIISAYIEKL